MRLVLHGFLAFASMLVCGSTRAQRPAAHVKPPRLLDDAWNIELVRSEPELVTPTGCCFDDQGRLLVIECNTHFAPEGYDRAATDRIYIFDDSNGDGVLDRQRLFFEGGIATMNLTNLGGGWIGVATRSHVVRLRDSDGDDVADQSETLLTLETTATYPHNGLGGLTLGGDGWLYVGQGENFGEPYRLIASDKSVQVGGGEGGNIFRVRPDGSNLQRVATGFWNPFGLCVDSASRVWTVGNDPDAMPPCRLLHVVPAGDYGFQFRFGRAGTHPLQAWDGELPGTLPMTAGTGEATCAVIEYGDALWVTSWGDNRIERYSMVQNGATWTSRTEVVVQGDANFRPVGIAAAPDGSIYVTDWVDRSYPVHGKGRLWRLTPKQTSDALKNKLPRLSDGERMAIALQADGSTGLASRLDALDSDDPFLRTAAMAGLVHTNQLQAADWESTRSPMQRAGMLNAFRWQEMITPESLSSEKRAWLLRAGLADDSEHVLITAIRWATEQDCKDQLETIRGLLNRQENSPRLFAAIIASIAYLETGSAARGRRDPEIEKLLVQFALDASKTASLRGLAIRKIPAESNQPENAVLVKMIEEEPSREFALEVVRLLAERDSKPARDSLAAIAANEAIDLQTRADALAALSRSAGEHAKLMVASSLPRQPEVLRNEAKRIIQPRSGDNQSRPPIEDLDAWDHLVGTGGDADAGRRVFVRTTCITCHAHAGRGAKTGPDLTTIGARLSSRRLLESILLPSKEIGPLYVPWSVLTVDGKVLTGLKLDGSGAGESMRFQGADGVEFSVPMDEIEIQDPLSVSIMPTGLQDTMSLDELRDLVAFLLRTDDASTDR